MTLVGPIFSMQPWRTEFGDRACPEAVLGVAVQDRLLARRDDAGALVLLADRRCALTGAVLVVGPPRQLALYVRQRAHRSASATERDWLLAVASTVAARLPGQQPDSRGDDGAVA